MADLHIKVVHDKSVDEYITKYHYLHSAGIAPVIRMWFIRGDFEQFIDTNKKLGAMIWGNAVSRYLNDYNENKILELRRMYFIDDTEKNIESKALAMARRYIRKQHPHIKGIISYSSTGEGHEGTIYSADNWFVVSSFKSNGSHGGAWSRDNADNKHKKIIDRDNSRKICWARSP